MKVYKMDLRFESQKEYDAWIEANLKVNGREMYNGEYVMMLMASGECGSDAVVLQEIWTC